MANNHLETFKPIFIVGNSRSGTTLLGRILGNSPAVLTFEELHFFEGIWTPQAVQESISKDRATMMAAKLLNIQRNDYLTQKDIQLYLDEAQLFLNDVDIPYTPPRIFSEFLEYETRRLGKQRPCEQTPRNVLYIDEILKFYPQAQIINIVRDPRDVLLSQKRKWRRSFQTTSQPKVQAVRYWINYHPVTMSKLWNLNVKAAEKYKDDGRVFFLKFEDLLATPLEKIKEICEFADIPFDLGLLEVPRIGSSSEPDQHNSKGINSDRKQSWRKGGLTSSEVFICQLINKQTMLQYKYPLEKKIPNVVSLTLSIIFFPIKLALAFLLSLNRMKNIIAAIARRLV